MATYAREYPAYLRAALASCVEQTEMPAEIVLVIDGPIPVAQEEAIAAFARRAELAGVRFITVRNESNIGLARSLNAGLPYCTQPYVARMDSDDVSVPDRFASQWRLLQQRPEIGLVASWQEEFANSPADVTRVKTVPEEHGAIIRVLRWRNAVSHPSIVVRRDALERIGGYRQIGYVEDHDLFLRLADSGIRFYAIQRPLLKVRVSEGQRMRRGGWVCAIGDIRFRWSLYQRGTISFPHLCVSCCACVAFRLAPPGLKGVLYINFLRRAPGPG